MNSRLLKPRCHYVEAVTTDMEDFMSSKVLLTAWVELKYTFEKCTSAHQDMHEALTEWVHWAQQLSSLGLSDNVEEMYLAIASFAEDLATIHELWGDTLTDEPHHIWKDVTAFTLSTFLLNSEVASTKTILSEDTKQSGLSRSFKQDFKK